MGVGAGLYMCDVVKKFTFAISSPDEFLYFTVTAHVAWIVLKYKVLSYGRGTARRQLILSVASQLSKKSHLKRLAISERPCGHSRWFEMPRFDKRYITSYNWSAVTTSVVHYLWDIGTNSNDLEWLWRSLWLSEAFLTHIHWEIGYSTY